MTYTLLYFDNDEALKAMTDDVLPPDTLPQGTNLDDESDPIPDEAGITPGEDDPEASEVDIPDLEE